MSEEADQVHEPANAAAYFGEETKALREALGLSQNAFAVELHYQQAQVSKVEGGSVLASEAFAMAMDRVARTPGVYVRLRTKLSKRGHPEWFVPYVNLEREAVKIENYGNAFIMGLLQTPAYAEGTFRSARPRETDDQIKTRVEARMRRHEVMDRDEPPLLWSILHESLLHTVVGSPTVMQEQMDHLVAEAATPHVTLQVLPYRAGAPASSLPFILLTPQDGATVLYSETRRMGHVSDSKAAVGEAQATYDRLRASALSPEDSLALIRRTAEDYAS